MGFDIGKAVEGAAGPVLGALTNAFGIGEKRQDKRQLEQQRKLQGLSIEGSKALTDYNMQKQMEMWKNTNWAAQMKEAEDAGLSTAWLMGKGGGTSGTIGSGGMSVGGGNASDAASAQNAATNQAMAIAQMENIKANTEKTKAEAENLSGVTRENTAADTASKKWMTELSQKLNNDSFIKDVQEQQNWATQKLETSAKKEMQEWETALAAGFTKNDGTKTTFDDPESPMAKAIRAGFEETIQKVENLKKQGNIMESEKAIKAFEANLTRQGIAAGSPWYVKMVGDMLKKLGINLTGDTASVIKQ